MEQLEPVLAGIALSACAGFRVFLPLLSTGLLLRLNGWQDPPVIEWAATDQGLLLLAVASLAEVLADKVPLIDHALDSVHTLLKPLAAVLVTVGLVHHLSPGTAWVLAIIAGAPVAAGLHLTKATLRGLSTGVTGGLGNPVLSFLEDLVAVVLAVLAVLLPVLAFALAVWLAAQAGGRWAGRRRASVRAARG